MSLLLPAPLCWCQPGLVPWHSQLCISSPVLLPTAELVMGTSLHRLVAARGPTACTGLLTFPAPAAAWRERGKKKNHQKE